MSPYVVIPASLLIGYFTSKYAKNKNRRTDAWFVLGFMFGALAPLILAFLPKLEPEAPTEEPPAIPTFYPPEWYYLNEAHQQIGPLSLKEMREAYQNGSLQNSSYIWNEDMPDWAHLSTFPKVIEALSIK